MMLKREGPVRAAIPPGGLPAEPLPGLPSPRLTATGRFRAGKAPEVLAVLAPRAPALACPHAGPAQARYDSGPAEA
jgi:hypothetical protein